MSRQPRRPEETPPQSPPPERQSAPSRPRRARTPRSAGLASWPLLECLVSRDWRVPGRPAQLVVARRSPEGAVAAGVFLVDLGCLGVKDAGVLRHPSVAAWREGLADRLVQALGFTPIGLDQAARIVRDGVAFARALGFEPHPSFTEAEALLAGARPDAAPEPVPLGRDGKPFFVSGARDDARQVVRQLERAVGTGNFRAVLLGSTLGPQDA